MGVGGKKRTALTCMFSGILSDPPSKSATTTSDCRDSDEAISGWVSGRMCEKRRWVEGWVKSG